MAHVVDFHSLEDDLFILEHLVHGSRGLSEVYRLDRNKLNEGSMWLLEHGYDVSNETDFEWLEYSARLHGAVSTRLVSISVKSRILWDAIRVKFPEVDLADYQVRACDRHLIGELTGDKVELNLRETWNKVIHGTKVELEWTRLESESTFEYWSGVIVLSGEKQGKSWTVRLNTGHWIMAMWNFHSMIEEDDAIDWTELYS